MCLLTKHKLWKSIFMRIQDMSLLYVNIILNYIIFIDFDYYIKYINIVLFLIINLFVCNLYGSWYNFLFYIIWILNSARLTIITRLANWMNFIACNDNITTNNLSCILLLYLFVAIHILLLLTRLGLKTCMMFIYT